ncbi:hypothetical protein MRY87_00150 [bacterium]|nr:hypothetical protein [bacterium]
MKEKTVQVIRKGHRDEKGLTLLEYAAGAAFVLAISAGAFAIFDQSITQFFNGIGGNMNHITGDTTDAVQGEDDEN